MGKRKQEKILIPDCQHCEYLDNCLPWGDTEMKEECKNFIVA